MLKYKYSHQILTFRIDQGEKKVFNFNNKVVVVTGGARGIGKCICEEFEKTGAKVCVIDLLENPYFKGDLSDKAALEQFADKVIAEYGHVDYLINNAAPLSKGIQDCSYEEFCYALNVGVTAAFYLSKLFMPYFAKDAAIINISSIGSILPDVARLGYGVSKAAVNSLTQNIAVQYAKQNIRCNAVLPGLIATDAAIKNMSEDFIESFLKHVPLHRMGHPEDIANAFVFLASDEASYITGVILSVDGMARS